ncbi:MAG: UDP-N-acetylmuramate--L-alanine ligase [Candidatus Paceibacterota bacterium]|jgi:UDP-N-acetylmuramate--alanine ligase
MKIYFIGIGGIGMSALARYYKTQKHIISGSDLSRSEIINDLIEEGFAVKIGKHNGQNITKDIDLVVYSAAILDKNPELKRARELGIVVKRYSTVLGELTNKYYSICVAGAHGKSTTTAMLSLVLIRAGLDPTVIIGTKLKEFGNSNFRNGRRKISANFKKPILILEADEWSGSFLNYASDIAIITNIEKEHLDYYKKFKNVVNAFKVFSSHVKKGGMLILNKDSKGVLKMVESLSANDEVKRFFYHLDEKDNKEIVKFLNIPGRHNRSNALAVITAATVLGIKKELIFEAIASYQGSWRRFEVSEKSIKDKKITIINDYAHHPTEIIATIQAVKEKYHKQKIHVLFQPHQRQRMFYLFKSFISAFDGTDNLMIIDIYEVEGREKNNIEIGSKELVVAINERWNKKGLGLNVAKYLEGKLSEIAQLVLESAKDNEILIIMGAGDIWEINKYF